MTGRRRQKHKGRKRPKHWHRGASEARRWSRVHLPDVGSDADPTTGHPDPNRRKNRRKKGPTP